MPKGVVNRFVNTLEPVMKTGYELSFGKSTYPEVLAEGEGFKFTGGRQIRSRWEHLAGVFSLKQLVSRVLLKRPHRKSEGPIEDFLNLVLFYNTDPGEAAHFQTKEYVSRWQKENDKERLGGFGVTPRSNALYYWKKAIQWEDEKAADHWLEEYRKLGGTRQGMEQSIRMSSPLGGLAEKDRGAFSRSLSQEEKDVVKLALKWWKDVYGSGGSRNTTINRTTR